MSQTKLPEALVHPNHGRLPAQRLLDCVFALSPNGGPILHYHIDEFDESEADGLRLYTFNGTEPGAERYRCQVIPPRVPQFPQLD